MSESKLLEKLSLTDFAPLVGQPFCLSYGPAGSLLELVLSQANELGDENLTRPADLPQRHPFSLIFLGPRQPVLPQQIYRIEHPKLGQFDIFIVPVGAQSNGVQYEAIFN